MKTRKRFLIPPHSLKTFEIQKHYNNKPKFHGVYSRNRLHNSKDKAHVINLDEYKAVGTHWIALYVIGNNVIYFNSFGVHRQ